MDKIKESKGYYNKFHEKLIRDYIKGNLRMEQAIKNCLKYVPKSAKNVLDIGCGIGWSSHELYRIFKLNVTGIDLSENSIMVAKKLFTEDDLNYDVVDVTSERFTFKNRFDYIVLIDVYEHIPLENRCDFNESLKNLLNDDGAIFLSCPSIYHQAYLKENNPGGLQPVDEDVTNNDIKKLANVVGGEVHYLEYQNIFRNKDYFHAVIRKWKYEENNIGNNELENYESRKNRIKTKLRKYQFITRENGKKNLRDIVKLRTRLKNLLKWKK